MRVRFSLSGAGPTFMDRFREYPKQVRYELCSRKTWDSPYLIMLRFIQLLILMYLLPVANRS